MSVFYPLAHLGLFLLEWVLLVLAVRLWLQSTSVAMVVLPILLASISYDNLILTIGSLIGEGESLKALSMLRFLLHYVVVPLFTVIGVELAHRAGADWATTTARIISWIVALGLAGIDIATNYISMELVPVEATGILRYINANQSGPPIITISVNLFVLLIGIRLWKEMNWSWLFLGTLIAFIGNVVSSLSASTLPGSAAEFIMALSLLLTEQRTQSLHSQVTSRRLLKST